MRLLSAQLQNSKEAWLHTGGKRFVIHDKVVQKCLISSKKKKNKAKPKTLLSGAFETITQLPVFTNVLCAQLCPALCNPIDSSPPGSSVHGIPQARILSGLPCPPPGDLPHPGIHPVSPALTREQVGETTKQTDPRNNGRNRQGLRDPQGPASRGPSSDLVRVRFKASAELAGRPAASAGPGGAAEALPLVLAPRTAAQRRGCRAGGTTEP